jgi:glucose/arabinose dehydrogenase
MQYLYFRRTLCGALWAAFFLLPACSEAQTPAFRLLDRAANFDRPVDIAHCGDSRLFIVEKTGTIWILDSTGKRAPTPFLNIRSRVNAVANERGLLGLAFHPRYAENGWFFVNYTRSDGATRIARYTVSAADPQLADVNSELIILEIEQPFANHNGGCLKFGPDGKLYIGTGDGGSGGDPFDYGQNGSKRLGKFLRIDVDSASVARPYQVPSDNPFVGNAAYAPEIWSVGWRNPWRFSFDRLTGDLWVGDVGQNAREEIDVEAAGKPGRNYGWRCREGNQNYSFGATCPPVSDLTEPVFSYGNPTLGCSVTGGYVYRGREYPAAYGLYFFTDYCSGRWWTLAPAADGRYTSTVVANLADNDFSSLGEDVKGELYVAGHGTGRIYKVAYGTSVAVAAPADMVHCAVTPNSATDHWLLQVTLAETQTVQAVLMDLHGRVCWQQKLSGQQWNTVIPATTLTDGVYFLQIATQKGRFAKKLLLGN